MRHRPLTRLAHSRIASALQAGDLAVDATVGNAHDTRFLAEQVGEEGHVWGFDVQPSALAAAGQALAQQGLSARVTLVEDGHQALAERLPLQAQGRLAVVMFNLGYLPGSDKQITTRAATTLPALDAAVANLRPGGLLSVLTYRGHPGGDEEAAAVASWMADAQGRGCRYDVIESPGPILYLLTTPA